MMLLLLLLLPTIGSFHILFECFAQNYTQFKRRFAAAAADDGTDHGKTLIANVRSFLNELLFYSSFLNTSNDINSVVTKFDKNFMSDTYKQMYKEANNDENLAKVYDLFTKSIEIDETTDEVVELKLKFLLVWLSLTSNNELFDKIIELLEVNSSEKFIELILNNQFVYENAFKSDLMTKFLIKLTKYNKKQALYDGYLNTIVSYEEKINEEIVEFISKIKLEKSLFARIVEFNDLNSKYYVEILLENQEHVFEKENATLFELCYRKLLKCIKKMNYELNEVDGDKFDEFMLILFTYKPLRCHSLIRETLKNSKNIEKFVKFSERYPKFHTLLTRLYDSELNLIENQHEINVLKYQNGGEHKNGHLVSEEGKYTFTLSKENQEILINKHKTQTKDGQKKYDWLRYAIGDAISKNGGITTTIQNNEIKMSDFIEEIINDKQIDRSIENYPFERKLSDLDDEKEYFVNDFCHDQLFLNDVYDPIYLLPNLYALLDYGLCLYLYLFLTFFCHLFKFVSLFKGTVVDVTQFTQSKCLSYLFVALSSKCDTLRAIAYASIYRFKSHLESNTHTHTV